MNTDSRAFRTLTLVEQELLPRLRLLVDEREEGSSAAWRVAMARAILALQELWAASLEEKQTGRL